MNSSDWSRLNGALLGAAFASVFAVTVACLLKQPGDASLVPDRIGALEWAQAAWSELSYIEDREKIFFALTLVFGSFAAWLGARFRIAGHRPTFVSVAALIVLVPLLRHFIQQILITTGPDGLARGAIGMASVAGLAALSFAIERSRYGERLALNSVAAPTSGSDGEMPRFSTTGVVAGLLVIAAFLLPLDLADMADRIGYELHMAMYMVGPATYEYGKNLVPGLDYFTQYSIGTPWLFSFLLSPSADQTIYNAVAFTVAEMIFFEVTLFFFLWWFLRGWGWALFITLIVLLLQFTTLDPLYAPSSTASRYPLAPVAAALVVYWIHRDRALWPTIALCLVLTLSLLVYTETGIYTCLAAAVTAVALAPNIWRGAVSALVLGVVTFAFFMLLSALMFGPRVFDPDFIYYYLEPVLLYGSGLGANSIKWGVSWAWLYDIVAPGLVLAGLGWALFMVRSQQSPVSRRQLTALVFTSVFAILLTTKYINYSIVPLWQVCSWGLVVVMAWWMRHFWESFPDRVLIEARYPTTVHRSLATAAAAFLLVVVATFGDGSWMSAIPSYRTYPSAVNLVLGRKNIPCDKNLTGCIAQPVAREDVEMIQRLTKPGEQVAVLGLWDWVYMLEAQRPPKFAQQPSAMMFTTRQIEKSLEGMDLIFLPNQPENFGMPPGTVADALLPTFAQDFEKVEVGVGLVAWRRIHKS